MAWSESSWHFSWLAAITEDPNCDAGIYAARRLKAAVYDDTAQPRHGSTNVQCYGGGGWMDGEVFDDPGWPEAGLPLTGITITSELGLDTVRLRADSVRATAQVTMAPHGVMVYDDESTLPMPGLSICYNWFGGVADVAAGLFTIVWDPGGIGVWSVEPVTTGGP